MRNNKVCFLSLIHMYVRADKTPHVLSPVKGSTHNLLKLLKLSHLAVCLNACHRRGCESELKPSTTTNIGNILPPHNDI